MLVGGVGLPTGILSIFLIKPLGGRLLNIYGFTVMCLAFTGLAITYGVSDHGLSTLKFVQFLLITAALNSGVGLGTYYLPTVLYPVEIRGTFNGLSAAAGKIGAVVGTFMYTPLNEAYGISSVLWVQAALSFLGAIICTFFLPDDRKLS